MKKSRVANWQPLRAVYVSGMDSLTQFALGGVVAGAMLGPRIGARAAILAGGALGTAPDLDTFLPSADAVAAFTSHRGWSHSLIIQALAAPLFAEALMRLFKPLRTERWRTWATVYLVFATHALLDAMTVYGTKLFWPLYTEPVGVGSMFIIDPLYTLPLLIVVVWALSRKQWTERLSRWTKGALAISTAYLAVATGFQQVIEQRAGEILAANGATPERVLAIPTPFNILYWKAIVIDGDRYLNLYLPLAGGPEDVRIYEYPRRADLIACLQANAAHRDLAAFSKGFYSVHAENGAVVQADLRMGLTPQYVFRFAIADAVTGEPLDPPRRLAVNRNGGNGDIDWLLAGIGQNNPARGAESENEIALADLTDRTVRVAACTSGFAAKG
ncbi:MAG: metal-dependent hydrolase [Alphaproteobacteria bacterium]